MPQKPVRVLRDVRLSTKVLILNELARGRVKGQRDLASALDVTPQMVSDYLKLMEGEGLLEREGRDARPTVEGVQFLQERLKELGDFTYEAMREVNVINSCSALAAEDIKEGERVVLELRDGVIVARPGSKGASRGVASRSAKEGEDLAVRGLEGIMELRIGKVTVAALPSAVEGGTARTDLKRLRARLVDVKGATVAAADPVGLVAARRLRLDVGIRFGVDHAVVDAALRGVDVLVLGGRDSLGPVNEAIEAHNQRSAVRIERTEIDLARP
jgi:putative transcriptional regulator